MEYVLTALWALIDDLALLLFLSAFLPVKRNRTQIVLGYLFFTAAQIILLNALPNPLHSLTSFIDLLLVSYYLFDGKLSARLILCVNALLISAVMDAVAGYGTSAILGLSVEEFTSRRGLFTFVVTSERLFMLLAAYLLKHFSSFQGVRMRGQWLLLALAFPTLSTVFLCTLFFTAPDQPDISVGAVILSIGLALANIGIQFAIFSLEKTTQKDREAALMRQQIALQSESITALEKSYRAQRQNVHEFRHHLQALHALLDEQQFSKAQAYLDSLQQTQTVRVFSVNSKNPILDVVLNEKYQAAQEKGIAMQIQVNDLAAFPLPEDATVVLLSNLLDNAIEAAEKCAGTKEIACCLLLEDSLYLSVRNTSPKVAIYNGHIITTKADKLNHGYGLATVRGILNQWNAEYTFKYADGWFQFAAEIPRPQ